MKLYLFNMLKRYNSTARPSTFDGAPAYDFSFRQPTDYTNPTIDLDVVINKSWNYAYIDELSAYYWIRDITILNSTQSRVFLQKDVLATFRESIRDTQGYILYAASGYDVWLNDTRVSYKQGETVQRVDSGSDAFTTDGYFALSVMSKIPHDGFTSTYYMTLAQLQQAVNYMLTLSDDVAARYINYYGGVAQCLQYCNFIPRPMPTGESHSVIIGETDTGLTAKEANGIRQLTFHTDTLTIPKPYSDFRLVTACDYKLYLPFVGMVDISADEIKNESALYVTSCVDSRLGDLIYTITTDSDLQNVIAIHRANCATSLSTAINSTKPSFKGTAATLTAGATNKFASYIPDYSIFNLLTNNVVHNIDATTQLVDEIVNERTWQSSGSNGSQGELGVAGSTTVSLFLFRKDTTSPDALTNNLGRPVQKYGKISDYSGFIKMSGVFFETQGAILGEINQVTAFLNGGFYNE